MAELSLDVFRLTPEALHLMESAQRNKPTGRRAKKKRTPGLFLLGPVPMTWLAKACRSPHSSKAELFLGLLLWHRHGMQQRSRHFRGEREVVRVNLSKLAIEYRFPRRSLQRGLEGLERHGLVTVERKPGRAHSVRIVEDVQ